MNDLLDTELKHHRSHLNNNNECFLLKEYNYNNITKIDYSVIIPIYNQEKIITKNINSILKYTGGIFEIILILDFCYDNTELNLINFLDNYQHSNNNLSSIKIFKQPNSPIFEASCDNIGFVMSKGKYCLEIQSDMEMTENNYNLHLTKPFKLMNNILAVSGRCAHNLFNSSGGIGMLGLLIEKSVSELTIDKNKFYTYETCNRGPLLFDRQKLKQLNYLDEINYHMDNSDHDIMVRGYLHFGYICGYVPIDFNSPLHDGSSRKNSNNINEKINLKYKQLRMSRHKIKSTNLFHGNTLNLYQHNWKKIDPKIYEI
jgi:glycosyltransferase involved in cell wall biosynthesis